MKKSIHPPQPANTKTFKLSDFCTDEEAFHIARVNISTRKDLSYHSHNNYAELLWIEDGEGIHYINGHQVKIQKNEMVMIRPGDKHSFSAKGKDLTIINIAFSKKTLEYLRTRYFLHTNLYYWTPNPLPYRLTVSDKLIKRFSSRAEEAMRFKRSNLQLDSLLLFIFRNIHDSDSGIDYSHAPTWLVSAIKKYNHIDYFKDGVTSFVELCDRNADYVNRVIKDITNQTLTEFVNDIRIKYAADQLLLTAAPIKHIAHSCGFTSLAYFYKQFNLRFGQPPSDYRKLHQAIV